MNDNCARKSDTTSPPSTSHDPPVISFKAGAESFEMPVLGKSRCYWSILSPTLDFLFVDPVLNHHMGKEADLLVGTNLLNYVHPDERQSMARDLSSASPSGGIQGAGVFGSVTNCRYSLVTRVRKILGCTSPPRAVDMEYYAEESEEYLPLALTTSWIGGASDAAGPRSGTGKPVKGAVLCFFHALGDKSSHDNDESNPTPWTNWCGPTGDGSTYLDSTSCSALFVALSRATAYPGFSTSPSTPVFGDLGLIPNGPPPHVFQILDQNGRILLTFPRSEGATNAGVVVGSYDPESYAKLARAVILKPRDVVPARTSCTRRFRSKHPIMKGTTLTTVESVVIPYGAISFACHSTGGVYLSRSPIESTTSPSSTDSQHPTMGFHLEDVLATPSNVVVPPLPLHPDLSTNTAPRVVNKRASEPFYSPTASSSTLFLGSPIDSQLNKRRRQSAAPTYSPSSHYPPSFAQTGAPLSVSIARRYSHTQSSVGTLSPTVATASAILGSFSNPMGIRHGPSSGVGLDALGSGQQQSLFGYPSQPDLLQSSSSDPTMSHLPQGNLSPGRPSYLPSSYPYLHSTPSARQSFDSAYSDDSFHQLPLRHPLPQQWSHQQQTLSGMEQLARASLPSNPIPPVASSSAGGASLIPKNGSGGSISPILPSNEMEMKEGVMAKKKRKEDNQSGAGKKEGWHGGGSTSSRMKGAEPINKPGPVACASCGTPNSPEWRKGPDGTKSLCNACGLRYARSVTKENKKLEQLALRAEGGVVPSPPVKGSKKKGQNAALPSSSAGPSIIEEAARDLSPSNSATSSSQLHLPLTLPPRSSPSNTTSLSLPISPTSSRGYSSVPQQQQQQSTYYPPPPIHLHSPPQLHHHQQQQQQQYHRQPPQYQHPHAHSHAHSHSHPSAFSSNMGLPDYRANATAPPPSWNPRGTGVGAGDAGFVHPHHPSLNGNGYSSVALHSQQSQLGQQQGLGAYWAPPVLVLPPSQPQAPAQSAERSASVGSRENFGALSETKGLAEGGSQGAREKGDE